MINLTNWLTSLVEAFTLYGGGGKGGGSAPKTPNYEKLAITQADLDRQAAERNVLANRATQNTPWGNISWSQAPGSVDQAGFDQAMANYNKQMAALGGRNTGGRGMIQNPQTGMYFPASSGMYGMVNGNMWNSLGGSNTGSNTGANAIAMPNIKDYTRSSGAWTQDITLNPDDQARLTAQQKSQRALAEGAQGMLGRVNDAYSKEFNWADAPGIRDIDLNSLHGVREVDLNALPDVWDADWTKATGENGGMAIDTVKNALMSRIAPDLLRNRQREEAQMIAQGVGRGANEAWGKSQDTLGRNETDAAMQALLQGIGQYGNIRGGQMDWRNQVLGEGTGQFERDKALREMGLGEQQSQYQMDVANRNRYIAEQKAQRDLPMEEYLKLMGASGEVQMPQFPSYAQQGATNAPNMVGAAQDKFNSGMQKYNADQQGSSNFWNTAVQLGGLGASIFSDPRLKDNVVRVGTHSLGIGIYTWIYKWGQKAIGVMADEVALVKPEAVGNRLGFMTVDYGRL
jgi:hypothetical protein